jgi:arsenate reductase
MRLQIAFANYARTLRSPFEYAAALRIIIKGLEEMKPRVLFLCTGNSARSQMGEALLRKHAGEAYEALSAGTAPKGINPYTVQVMQEAGIDLSGSRSKSVTEFLGGEPIQTLITVCDDADQNCPTFPQRVDQRMHWSFEDPAALEGSPEEKLAKFREIRDRIEQKVLAWLEENGNPR